jgi:hypothetical protein
MTVGAGSRVEDWSKPAIDIVGQFENLLVEDEAVAVRFRDAVADALRAGILDKCRRIKACGRFDPGLLCSYRPDARGA